MKSPPKNRSPRQAGGLSGADIGLRHSQHALDIKHQNEPQELLATSDRWEIFCRLRLRSRAYRAVDDPIVALAYGAWLASYLADSETPKATNIIPLRKMGACV